MREWWALEASWAGSADARPAGGSRAGLRCGGGPPRARPQLLGALCAQPIPMLQGYLRESVGEWWGMQALRAGSAGARTVVGVRGGLPGRGGRASKHGERVVCCGARPDAVFGVCLIQMIKMVT